MKILLFEEFKYSEKTEALRQQAEAARKRMKELRDTAAKDPFHDSHADLKKQHGSTEKEAKKLETQLDKSKQSDMLKLGKRPFKWKTKEEQMESLENIFYALGYTDEDRNPKESYYRDADLHVYDDTHNGVVSLSIRVPRKYDDVYVKIDKKTGEVFTKNGERYWGQIPDKGSFWQHGTSGQNNPAPTSDYPDKSVKCKTIGDVVMFLLLLKDKCMKTHQAHVDSFSAYMAAGGSGD